MADVYDLSDLGPWMAVEEIDFDQVKPGDLIGFTGHIGMIIGVEKDTIYIADDYIKVNLHVSKLTKEEIYYSTWTHIILMDDYYGEDGNLTMMWY